MVRSKINPKIFYAETKTTQKDDIDKKSSVYESELYGTDIIFTLGQLNTSNDSVYHKTVYLIIGKKIVAPIGVVEFLQTDLLKSMDDEYMDSVEIIPFSHVNGEFLRSFTKPTPINNNLANNNTMDNDNITDNPEFDHLMLKVPSAVLDATKVKLSSVLNDGIFTVVRTFVKPEQLHEETQTIADALKKDFSLKKSSKLLWIQKYMKNLHYGITEVEGNGDCLFSVICEAFSKVGKNTTPTILRTIVANEMTDAIFQDRMELYTQIKGQIRDMENEKITLIKTYKQYKQRLDTLTDKPEKNELVIEMNKITVRLNVVKEDLVFTNELFEDFRHMETISTLLEYREYILTTSFWGDAWTISVLEHVLNVKLIIFSETAFGAESLDEVLQCGPNSDTHKFSPDYYIIASYSGNHYNLVTYKKRSIFTFREVPYDIKISVIIKCMEKNSGIYSKIPDFRDLKARFNLPVDDATKDPDEVTNLCDNGTIFVFYEKSQHKPAGNGSNETIKSRGEYIALNKIKDWRRKLDDTHLCNISVDGHKFASVLHYLEFSKFVKTNETYAFIFTKDSNTDVSQNIDALLRNKPTVNPDATFMYDECRKRALTAKFEQNMDLKFLLTETKNACLKHFVRRQGAITDEILMQVRNEIM